MANEKFTQLPTVTNATVGDIICAVQAGISSQETLQQIQDLMQSNIIQNYAGDPNGNVAGKIYALCWDTSNSIMYVCTTTGSTSTAVWTASSYPASVVTPAHGGTGVASPTAHGIAVAEGSSNFTFKTLTNGQLLIGSTGADPVAATLSAGAGISISDGAGTITISGTGSGIGWTEVTGTTQSMVADSGYVANNAGVVTFTLPTTAAFGTALTIIGKGAGGWAVAQNVSQVIQIGSVGSTAGVGGSIASTNRYDSIELICTTANTVWTSMGSPQGIITIV